MLAWEPERPAGGEGAERSTASSSGRWRPGRTRRASRWTTAPRLPRCWGRLLTALREDRYDYRVAVETEF
ncbi:MAG: hypothetical protein ACLSAF_11725 [Intestinimonas sp.]